MKVVIVIQSEWKNVGTDTHPFWYRTWECLLLEDRVPHEPFPHHLEDGDKMWVHTLTDFLSRFEEEIKEWCDERGHTKKQFKDCLIQGVTLDQYR